MSRVKLKKRYYYLFENIYPGRAMSFSLLPLIGFNILHLYSSPMMTSEPTTIPKLELTKYSHSIKINNYGKKLKIIFITFKRNGIIILNIHMKSLSMN